MAARAAFSPAGSADVSPGLSPAWPDALASVALSLSCDGRQVDRRAGLQLERHRRLAQLDRSLLYGRRRRALAGRRRWARQGQAPSQSSQGRPSSPAASLRLPVAAAATERPRLEAPSSAGWRWRRPPPSSSGSPRECRVSSVVPILCHHNLRTTPLPKRCALTWRKRGSPRRAQPNQTNSDLPATPELSVRRPRSGCRTRRPRRG